MWHVVKDESILINRRPCSDSMFGADGVECGCSCIGDLPVVALNREGERCSSLVRNVRCVPGFVCPMLSVRQLWRDSQVDTVFRDTCSLIVPTHKGIEHLPFRLADDCLYRWDVLTPGRMVGREEGCRRLGSAFVASPIHGGHSNSHVEILNADMAGMTMHQRLHVSASVLRRLPSCTTDAPDVLRRCPPGSPVRLALKRTPRRYRILTPPTTPRRTPPNVTAPVSSSMLILPVRLSNQHMEGTNTRWC